MQEVEFPDELTPLNLRAYFVNAFGACGCSGLESMLGEVVWFLEWHADSVRGRRPWEMVYPTRGLFYIMAGLFDNLGLSEHGTAIRHPWLTESGERLLEALRATSAKEIEGAQGEAYDGLWYGMLD